VFYRRAQSGTGARLARSLCRLLPGDHADLVLDRQRLAAVRQARQELAAGYFADHAASWDQVRSLYVDDAKVEAELLALFTPQPPRNLLDIGTGTGRILQLFAPQIGFGLGVDLSREMLAVARASLDRTSLRNCQVRLADMYHLPLPDGGFEAATLHNVLHFADNPAAVLAEAARVLAPGGRLAVVDFAPHQQEFLRREHAHRRLGFADAEISKWFTAAGLELQSPIRLAGNPLTVVIWSGRRSAAIEQLPSRRLSASDVA
jgi:ArsR family transcriptional regulator